MEGTSTTKQRRILLALILVLCGLIIAWGAVNFISHLGSTKLVVKVIPDDSKITLNGKPIRGGTVYLKPGHYVFVATRKDFGPASRTIDVREKTPGQTIYLLPVPNTPEAIVYLNTHPEVQRQREVVGATNSVSTQAELTKKYPILNKLPAYNSSYRIDYTVGAHNTVSFKITLYAILNNPNQYQQYQQQLQDYKAQALQFLQTNGINPEKFSITYSPDV